ncbi:MAG: YbbR-like domain-containing protein, partial [Planctomycetota bacterium]
MTKTRLYTPEAARYSLKWWFDGIRNFFFIAVILVLLSPAQHKVTFKLGGTRKALADFQRELEKRRSQIVYDITGRYKAGKHELPAEEILGNSEGPSLEGLAVLSASPGTIRVDLDRRLRQKAKVELDYVGAVLTAPAKIEPAEIVVNIAQSDLAEIVTDGAEEGFITIKTRRLDLRGAPTGEPVMRKVELLPPSVSHSAVTLEPTSVTVTVMIDQRTDEKSITITIQALGPSTWSEEKGVWNEYRLVKKDPLEWRPLISVQGAKKDLEKLRPEDVEAYIMLTEDDKTPVGSWLSRSVTVRFPKTADLQLVGESPI